MGGRGEIESKEINGEITGTCVVGEGGSMSYDVQIRANPHERASR
jgi:hypothetical protein